MHDWLVIKIIVSADCAKAVSAFAAIKLGYPCRLVYDDKELCLSIVAPDEHTIDVLAAYVSGYMTCEYANQ